MTNTQQLMKMLAGAMMAGGVALAGLGLAAAAADATPLNNGPLPEPFGPRWSADGSGGAAVTNAFEPPDPCVTASCHSGIQVQVKLPTGHTSGKR